ncbi:hypothetical protein RN607_05460 [Demequina capsici]|uniref:Uncharacterized protein n=1 Tax=Demequina capsici TaxID=3075620 RepID=A0AA96FDQ2_9MICO|nr:hypothetical protein [Demequina sp. PMTSA13]WNM28449.1 hypothetical protein RN607_05460 [Demequina sp. PMTSA13]
MPERTTGEMFAASVNALFTPSAEEMQPAQTGDLAEPERTGPKPDLSQGQGGGRGKRSALQGFTEFMENMPRRSMRRW